MEKRLVEKPHECEIETMVYAHGTHFVFPDAMFIGDVMPSKAENGEKPEK